MGLQRLLTVQQPRHSYLRNLVMPAFTPQAVEALTPRLVAVVTAYLEKWAESDGPVLAGQEMQSLAFDFICAVRLW